MSDAPEAELIEEDDLSDEAEARSEDHTADGAEDVDGVVDARIVSVGQPADPGAYSSCEEALEDAVTNLERVTAERDDYLDMARRVQAEFENYRKRIDAQRSDQIARAAESLVVELLPVLDAGEAALAHGAADVEPIHASLVATLAKQGLFKVDDVEVPFDPNVHEAVLSESGGEDDEAPQVAEVMRAGYLWNGRVVRPAMVKVRG